MNKPSGAAGIAAAAIAIIVAPILVIAVLFGGGRDGGSGSAHGSGAGLKAGTVPKEFAPWIKKAASTCTIITAPVIAAQIAAESGFNANAVSGVGAQGPAQFMPATWKTWGKDSDGNGTASPFDIGDAVMAQARYDCALAKQVKHVPGDTLKLVLAAYNAGPAAVIAAGGIPPYSQTQAYVPRIISAMAKYAAAASTRGGTLRAGGKKVHLLNPTADARTAIKRAMSHLGDPYVWGATGPHSWDCSSLVQDAYRAAGITLPRISSAQQQATKRVSRSNMRAGDLVFYGNPAHHVAMVLNKSTMIEAPHTGLTVRVTRLRTDYSKIGRP